jgi:K+-sensing histidine kinase KdpD
MVAERILLINRDRTTINRILTITENSQYKVALADSIHVALQSISQNLPDLILCEISLPEIDAYRLLNELKKDLNAASIPIIVLTEELNFLEWRRIMELGADDYLNKFCTNTDLLKAISTRLTKKRAYEIKIKQDLDELRNNINLALPHEFKTALTGIITPADFLLNQLEKIELSTIYEMVNCINVSGKRLNRIVHNFLFYAELELINRDREKIEQLQSARTHLGGKILQNIAIAQAKQQEREIDLYLEIEEFTVNINQKHLLKILEELLDNALKFSKRGTPIRISIKIPKNKNYFLISLSDRGRGMREQQVAAIGAHMQFERDIYEQQGCGLGLAIVKRIVEIYQGKLKIRSILNEGTIINICLPVPNSIESIDYFNKIVLQV